MSSTSLRLYQLNEYVRRVIALNFTESIWINCEIASFRESRGHAYLELIEKSDFDDEIIAQASAVIWRTQLNNFYKKLGNEAQAVLQSGKEVLIKIKVDFNAKYGLKLIIEDIDLSFTIGKLALKRQSILEELSKLNLIDKNKSISLPIVIQRLAIISSPTAAGWFDFQNHMQQNQYNYHFILDFYPSAMQGSLVESELCEQLKKIGKKANQYDCIIIIRGGGGKVDLSDFDNLKIATMIANSPLPVLTGIGHEIDESVADIVANTSLKTPTAVADFIISYNLAFENKILNMGWAVSEAVRRNIIIQDEKLSASIQKLNWLSSSSIGKFKASLEALRKDLPQYILQKIKRQGIELEGISKLLLQLSPEAHLKRGYTISLFKGKAITETNFPLVGDKIVTKTLNGTLFSTIDKSER